MDIKIPLQFLYLHFSGKRNASHIFDLYRSFLGNWAQTRNMKYEVVPVSSWKEVPTPLCKLAFILMLALKHMSCLKITNKLIKLIELKLLLILFHYVADKVFITFNVQAQTIIIHAVFNSFGCCPSWALVDSCGVVSQKFTIKAHKNTKHTFF